MVLTKLKKLKGRSVAELADRGRQSVSAFAERLGVSRNTKPASLHELFVSPEKFDDAGVILDHFRTRLRPSFHSSFTDREATIRLLKLRYPDEPARIVQMADRILEGRFQLLGYPELYFGGSIPNWRLDPRTGKESPRAHWSLIREVDSDSNCDNKIIWELNRHQFLVTLGQAYWLTSDERYAEHFVRLILDWTEANPPKIGINWLSSLEIGFRSISWIWALMFFRDSPSLTPSVFVDVLRTLDLNGRHLESHLSTYSSPNTHLTGEALALYAIGNFFPEMRLASRWKEKAHSVLIGALGNQIREDGGYCEQSLHYHRYTADFYLYLLSLRKLSNEIVHPIHHRKLHDMLSFLLHVVDPDGQSPAYGDEDGGKFWFFDGRPISDLRACFAVGAVLFGDPRFKHVACEPSADLLWLLGSEGLEAFDKLVVCEPDEHEAAFKESGVFSYRSSWRTDADFVLIDCGEHGFGRGGHGHADALSFVLSVGGERIFIDSGTYSYAADIDSRNQFRSTSAHNCLTVDGESSSELGDCFSWNRTAVCKLVEWSPNANGVRFVGTHDGFEHLGVDYERSIELSQRRLEVIDRLQLESNRIIEVNFILSPSVKARIIGDQQVELGSENGRITKLSLRTRLKGSRGSGSWRIEEHFVSPVLAKRIKTTRLSYRVECDTNCEIGNIVEW